MNVQNTYKNIIFRKSDNLIESKGISKQKEMKEESVKEEFLIDLEDL